MIYTAQQVAQMLDCSVDTVELKARQGELPGLQYGRPWIFPEQALLAVLNNTALTEMIARRPKPAEPDVGPATAALRALTPVPAAPFGPRRVTPPALSVVTPPERA